ncbi:hypothetical protein AB0I98_21990 [Streptomyces sp. NPDC050211]|uniref:hypothetical protein n=1 Tax=Streptomyces sp. NPDC050211 TaxID=3154932 RepID=UPI003412A3EB
MNDPTPAPPAPPVVPEPPSAGTGTYDPWAVALGNASLLGVGYLILRRRGFAAVALAVTFVLALRLGSTASPSYEIAMVVWWAAVIVHGWFLARRGAGARRGSRLGQWLVALGVTLPVLLGVVFLRVDAAGIERSVSEARERGDCAEVARAQDRVSYGHRLADAPLTADGDEVVRTCDRLAVAQGELNVALVGDTAALRQGFRTLASVLAEPGDEKAVEATLDEFLDDLPHADACDAVTVIDWLNGRKLGDDLLDRSAGTAQRVAPAALVGCGDDLMRESKWKDARTRYERLLDQYPDDDLTGRAGKGVKKATQNIELDTVRGLLAAEDYEQPEYCSHPVKYSGAGRVGKGVNRALFPGDDEYAGQLPASWRADAVEDAVLVVCVGDGTFGSAVRTCPYEYGSDSVTNVTFHKIAMPVKVYELRTGKLVTNRKIQIDGSSCPPSVSYYEYGYDSDDSGPDPDDYVQESKSDVRDAFRPLVVR